MHLKFIKWKRIQKAFTLLELLLVIAVISILITILLPSLAKARYKAQLAVCKSNLSQIGKMNMAYVTNNDLNSP